MSDSTEEVSSAGGDRGSALERCSKARIPTAPGTYILILETLGTGFVQIGALGMLWVMPGFYAYVGSARGSGGLAARLAHHRRRSRNPYWHIDYLRHHAALREVWLTRDAAEREHGWAGVLGSSPGASIPLARFGATDCRCRSHLFHLTDTPRLSVFRRRLVASGARLGFISHPEVVRWVAA